MAKMSFSTIDRLAKPTSTTFNADNAVTGPQVQALADALDAIILGAPLRAVSTVETIVDQGSAAPPASNLANRGDKWLLRIQDDVTGQIYTHEIGTADYSQLASPTSDFVDLTVGTGLAVKTALEAAYESPDGNAGTLLSIQQVTRTD